MYAAVISLCAPACPLAMAALLWLIGRDRPRREPDAAEEVAALAARRHARTDLHVGLEASDG